MKKFNVITKLEVKAEKLKEYVIDRLGDNYQYDDLAPDYCFAIGGDGTLLYAIHQYIDQLDHVQFIGINAGTLGFFSDYTANELDQCLDDFMHKEGHIVEYQLLRCDTNQFESMYALNEFRVEVLLKTKIIDVYINDHYFETFRGNGLLVCTQAGSTGYNRSLNGAIIDHGVECIQLNEIAAINRQKFPTCGSPIIFSKDTKITFKGDFTNASLIYDLNQIQLLNEDEINICQSDRTVQVLRYQDVPYLQRIKTLF